MALLANENRGFLSWYNLTANSTLIELQTLEPFSEYNVSIAASTIAGMGPFTAPHRFYTPEDGEADIQTTIGVGIEQVPARYFS